MSIKHYCDVCDVEINRNVVADRIKESSVVRNKTVGIEISVSLDGVWNAGDLCKSCLFNVLDRFDPRPRAAEAA